MLVMASKADIKFEETHNTKYAKKDIASSNHDWRFCYRLRALVLPYCNKGYSNFSLLWKVW
jgi:hypothetical protein